MLLFYRLLALGSPLLLAGCAIYVPTTPSTPLLAPREVELYGNVRGTSLEAGAAWSPLPHLLLSSEGAWQSSSSSSTTNNVTTTYDDYHRQGGLGIGYCRPAPTATGWYLAALGGVGLADVSLHAYDVGIISPYVPIPLPIYKGLYEARYRRYYLQGYAARPLSPWLTGGLSLRATAVDYASLTFEGQAVSPTNTFFWEPTLFLRAGHRVVQAQASLGVSLPSRRNETNPINIRTSPTTSIVSLGLVLRPDLLWQKLHRAD